MDKETFRISSALKNLIGKELITDEFVAVFELVKNSFDAYSDHVQIIFENLHEQNKAKIIIKDNGKGMNSTDIEKKWLFVAYSAKNMGEEDNDYRNRIKIKRIFAGAKGVGRFSCDRLGSKLNLITIKDETSPKIENVIVNWDDFEEDPKKEFIDIKVARKVLNGIQYKMQNGTILEIGGLRDKWDRDRILKLKKSLSKLINPNQENDSKNFQIEIIVPNERANDEKANERDKINGFVINEIFESLKIKTTSLSVKISKDGKEINSVLQDRGDIIYSLREKNPFKEYLHDINFILFQLNFKAKMEFNKTMGMESVKYGSVFMYKNGFRVYPFGEPGEDLLLIDKRKAQGHSRYLGTRDLIGRIEINGKQPGLKETTSRDGGFVKTVIYDNLLDFFEKYVLKRLENYVVNIIKWGDERINEVTGELIHPELWAKDVKIQILELITGFIKSENVIKIDYDKDFLNIIQSKQDKSVEKIIKNISKIAAKSNNKKIVKEAAKIGKVVKKVKADADKDKKRADEAEVELEQKTQQLRIATAISSQDLESVTNLHHQVLVITEDIKDNLVLISRKLEKDGDISLKDLKEFFSLIAFDASKIESISKFGTRAIFEDFTSISKNDIIEFMQNYIHKISKHFNSKRTLTVDFHSNLKHPFILKFRPLDISIIIDNMISNAKKANASNLSIVAVPLDEKSINLIFKDNGDGLNTKINNPKDIFQKGFSTTKSTGLGLFHIMNLANDNKWGFDVNPKTQKGIEFILTLHG